MATFSIEIVTTLKAPEVREVQAVDVPGAEGRLTVLAGHVPIVCALVPGVVRITLADSSREEWRIPTTGVLTMTGREATLLSREPLELVAAGGA